MLLLLNVKAASQNNCSSNISITKQEFRTNINLPNSNLIRGFVEHVPNGYWSNNNINYPLVIFVHGRGNTGNGTANALCNLFDTALNYPTTLIEQNKWPTEMVTANGQRFPFITLTPQFSDWYFSEEALSDFIQYAINRYRVNQDRIYLIGASQGAEVIQKYVGSNNRSNIPVAAIVPIAACKYITDAVARNIGSGSVGVWTSQCQSDLMCDANAAVTNQAKINSFSNDQRAVISNFPEPGFDCLPDPHDTWSIMLNPNYRKNINNRSMNIFDFMISYTAGSTLPVKLLSFDATIKNNQPYLTWRTASEENGHYFYIERAKENEEFKRVDSVQTKNDPMGASYVWVDTKPFEGKIQYRLSQVDKDGSISYFSIKWLTSVNESAILIKENPFRDQLKFEVNTQTTEPNILRVLNINGKTVYQQNIQTNATNIALNIPTAQWPNGMYIIQYGKHTMKVLKQ